MNFVYLSIMIGNEVMMPVPESSKTPADTLWVLSGLKQMWWLTYSYKYLFSSLRNSANRAAKICPSPLITRNWVCFLYLKILDKVPWGMEEQLL